MINIRIIKNIASVEEEYEEVRRKIKELGFIREYKSVEKIREEFLNSKNCTVIDDLMEDIKNLSDYQLFLVDHVIKASNKYVAIMLHILEDELVTKTMSFDEINKKIKPYDFYVANPDPYDDEDTLVLKSTMVDGLELMLTVDCIDYLEEIEIIDISEIEY